MGPNVFWACWKNAKEEFQSSGYEYYHQWIREEFGVDLEIDRETGYTGCYEIVDEKKYVTFLLKFAE